MVALQWQQTWSILLAECIETAGEVMLATCIGSNWVDSGNGGATLLRSWQGSMMPSAFKSQTPAQALATVHLFSKHCSHQTLLIKEVRLAGSPRLPGKGPGLSQRQRT